MSDRLRPILAAVALVAVAGISLGIFLDAHARSLVNGRVPPPMSLFEARFAPLKPVLPKDRPAGYVTDLPSVETRSYYCTRYVLSPTRVVWQTPCEFAVGDFYDPRTTNERIRRAGFDVVEDFGNGVRLLRRRAP